MLEVLPQVEARRYSIGEALRAAGAQITEAQAQGSNLNALMRRRYQVSAREWLEARGWSCLGNGRDWIAPQGGKP